MMFYNGFNLMIDLIIAGLVFYFTRRTSWWQGYRAGIEDTNEYAERAGDYWLEQEREREH